MQVTAEKHPNGHMVRVELKLLDGDTGLGEQMSAGMIVPHGKVLETITSPAESRSVAAFLVGRMTTQWKLQLIQTISEAVAVALQGSMTEAMRGDGPED